MQAGRLDRDYDLTWTGFRIGQLDDPDDVVRVAVRDLLERFHSTLSPELIAVRRRDLLAGRPPDAVE